MASERVASDGATSQSNRVALPHPRREAIGAALARAFGLPGADGEARAERKELRRIEIREAVRK